MDFIIFPLNILIWCVRVGLYAMRGILPQKYKLTEEMVKSPINDINHSFITH